jgi:hypothetical protein
MKALLLMICILPLAFAQPVNNRLKRAANARAAQKGVKYKANFKKRDVKALRQQREESQMLKAMGSSGGKCAPGSKFSRAAMMCICANTGASPVNGSCNPKPQPVKAASVIQDPVGNEPEPVVLPTPVLQIDPVVEPIMPDKPPIVVMPVDKPVLTDDAAPPVMREPVNRGGESTSRFPATQRGGGGAGGGGIILDEDSNTDREEGSRTAERTESIAEQ